MVRESTFTSWKKRTNRVQLRRTDLRVPLPEYEADIGTIWDVPPEFVEHDGIGTVVVGAVEVVVVPTVVMVKLDVMNTEPTSTLPDIPCTSSG